ncbi:MAG: DUF4080 domain-containing protein, partial [Hyphomonadaceae bacterium]|nr:DUF4080 domain-containing protein [Clostridia bacterium]
AAIRDFEGYTYCDNAPYEVLATPWLTHAQLLALKRMEDMVEKYHNSGVFQTALTHICPHFAHPFAFFEALANFFEQQGWHLLSHSQRTLYDHLFTFCQAQKQLPMIEIAEAIRFDLLKHHKGVNTPRWAVLKTDATWHQRVFDYLHTQPLAQYADIAPKNLVKFIHIAPFAVDVLNGKPTAATYLFDYKKTSVLTLDELTLR